MPPSWDLCAVRRWCFLRWATIDSFIQLEFCLKGLETSLGIGNSAGRMGLTFTLFVIPVILPFYFWDKTRQEKMIAASKIERVIVRPGALTNGEKRGA